MLTLVMGFCLALISLAATALACAGAWWCIVALVKDLERR